MTRLSDFTDAPLVLVGDEAYTPADLERSERRRITQRAYESRRRQRETPEQRAKRAAYMRDYVRAWRDRNPTYHRDWKRNHHHRVLASLHDLSCTGPTRVTGCRCRKVKLYGRLA